MLSCNPFQTYQLDLHWQGGRASIYHGFLTSFRAGFWKNGLTRPYGKRDEDRRKEAALLLQRSKAYIYILKIRQRACGMGCSFQRNKVNFAGIPG